MNSDSPTPEDHLRQLRHFLAWLLPTALGVIVLLLIVAFFFPARDLLIASAGIFCYSLLLTWGRVQLSQGHVWATVGTICFGLLALALGVTAMSPNSAQVLILLPFMAIGVALPYISGRALRQLSLAGWMIAVLVVSLEELDKYGSISALVPHGILMILGVAAAGALVLVLLWQFSNRLNTTLAQTRAANAALQEANAKLEAQHTQLLDDMARRQHAEEALRRSEEQFRLLFEAAPIGMSLTRIDSRFMRVNQALCATLGYSEGELQQRTIADITHPDDLSTHARLNQELLDGTRPFYQFEKRYISKDGRVIDALLHVVLVRDSQGEPLHFIGQVVDITERKRAEEQRLALERKLLETQKLESIGVLAGGIAHDFNNLLVGILGNADLALLELLPNSPTHTRVAQIATTARRTADLTQQMLAYAGKGRFVIGRIDLNALISETAQLLGASVTKHVDLRYQLAPDMPLIEGDATQLRQVVMNLIINASEAIGDQPGVIDVRTGPRQASAIELGVIYRTTDMDADDYVLLEVADSGSGMDAATLAKIFDPFFTTKFTGRGLGLAAVQGIVRSHGGALAVRSAPGEGTTFSILLPCAQQPATASATALNAEPDTIAEEPSAGVVLVIDDEPDVRTIAEQMLQLIGFAVLQARNGQAGVELFREHEGMIACVLLDLTMPHMDGEEVSRALHGIRADVPIVLMSGYSEQEVSERFDGAGLAGFLQKPFTISSLQRKLQQVLALEQRALQL
jgi:two-component system, cell cycle sensor histidine kinase and response regulator CckA